LSSDELQFIADFVGACILDTGELRGWRNDVTVRLARFQHAHAAGGGYPPDHDHKMILLLEYLCRAGLRPKPVTLWSSLSRLRARFSAGPAV
jgi:hypothetical protein